MFEEKPTYFSPVSDFGFHKIFCQEGNEQLVLQLLNALIDDKEIVSFTRLDPVHTVNTQSKSTFDLYCECSDGSRIIVECQNRDSKSNFLNRALSYSAMAVLDHAKAKWEYDFSKLYFLGILNYHQFKNRTQAITKVGLYTEGDHILTNPNYLQIFVELPKLAPHGEDESFSTLFLRAMRDASKMKERQGEYKDKRLDLLYKASLFNGLNKDEQKEYKDMVTTEKEYMAYCQDVAEDAFEDGMTKGREEGEAKKQLEIARAMKADGVDVNVIVKYTGLTEEQIKEL